MTQFIGVYENAFSKEYCERVIKHFDDMQALGFTENRITADNAIAHHKKDNALFLHRTEEFSIGNDKTFMSEFSNIFWTIYKNQYAQEFSVLQESGSHNIYSFKVQKTSIGGGYHVWHYESSNRELCNRLLAWTVYLNNVEEGGETEFLYQHTRIKPKAGTLCIFPASFTHTHRGNPPISNEKYIITGWVEF